MSLEVAMIAIGCALVVGLIVGVVIIRLISPDLRDSLAAAQQRVGQLEQASSNGIQEIQRLRQEVEEGRQAGRDKAALGGTLEALNNTLKEKDASIASLSDELGRSRELVKARESKVAELEERERGLNARLDTQRAEIEDLQKKLTTEFENIATKILTKTSTQLSETSEEKIANILNPLKERIGEFQKKVEETYKTENDERVNLKAELKHFVEANQVIGQQADKLANALRGEGQKRGKWGELVLERILESSGLQNGRDYVTQGEGLGLRSETGGIHRPDAIVYLPESKHIVIDSKVTLVSYEKCVEAEDVDSQELLHAEFVAAVRRHVDDLGSKSYQDNTKLGAHEMVLMFVPIEGALALAMRDDDLFQYAWQRRVAIVGPTSLLMTLRVVSAIWRYQRQSDNANQIAQRAGMIFDKLVGVVEALNVASDKLSDTKVAFDRAMGRLATGQGNALSQLKKLEDMGVKGKKPMPTVAIGEERLEVTSEEAETPSLA